ncbi:MAG: CocE/NonD family hydrolase [Alistipes sp.]
MTRQKFGFLLGLSLLLCTSLCAQTLREQYQKTECRIEMRDGVRLYTAVYTPKQAQGCPIIIKRTPYGCGSYGADEFSKWFCSSYIRHYIDNGYIIVCQDVRGRYMSEGAFEHVRPCGKGATDEATDAYDTVDWLIKNIDGNNGRVGFVGGSYSGFYAMTSGLSRHPAVKAVSPQAPVTDWFMGDDTHHNGVLMLTDSFGFIASMNTPEPHTPSPSMPTAKRTVCEPDEYSFFLQQATLSRVTQLLAPNPFWEAMMAHPNYDAWWQARDLRRACYDVLPAVLVVGGSFDAEDGYGTWNLYKALRQQSPSTVCHLVVGPWAHGAWTSSGQRLGDLDFGKEASSEYYLTHFEIPFFNHYLKGTGATDPLAAVNVFTSGSNRWHQFDRWLPTQAQPHTLFLTDGGGISDRKPREKHSYSEYVSDPQHPVPYNAPLKQRRAKEYMIADQRFVAEREDVLTFVTAPLTQPLTLIGALTADLKVAISTTDADFVVKLIDCDPTDGSQRLVRGDILRGRYRNSFTTPEPFVPEVTTEVQFELPDIAHTFRAGHRLMIQIQSSWFPLADRNPQQFIALYGCAAADFIPCRVRLYHQRNAASCLKVHQLSDNL